MPVLSFQVIPEHLGSFLNPNLIPVIDDINHCFLNIENMKAVCDNVFVVCSHQNQHYFDYKNKIVIDSGKGSGDAVWKAVKSVKMAKDDICCIQWGDTLTTKGIFETLIKNYKGNNLIPCVFEEEPYVQVIEKENHHVKIKFKKFNEKIGPGYHDLSVFCCNPTILTKYLDQFHNKICDKNQNYHHIHGNEMEFLDVFNETNIHADIVCFHAYKDRSFNTIEQLKSIENELFSSKTKE